MIESKDIHFLIIEIACFLFFIYVYFKNFNLKEVDFLALILVVGLVFSILISLMELAGDRYLIYKLFLFISVWYLSSQLPMIGYVLLIVFFADAMLGVFENGFGVSKYFVISFVSISLLVSYKVGFLNKIIFIPSLILDVYQYWMTETRGGIIIMIGAIAIYLNRKYFKVIIFGFAIFPVVYFLFAALYYYVILNGIQGDIFEATASNVERSSMAYVSVTESLNFLLRGPGVDFDYYVYAAMKIFDLIPYELYKGIDPHSFFLSYWRDAGTILTLYMIGIWCFFWKKNMNISLNENKISFNFRLMLSLLWICIFVFSASPPTSGNRIFCGAIFGLFSNLMMKNKISKSL